MTIQIVFFDGFDMLDALAPYEVFSFASEVTGGRISVKLVTAEDHDLIPSGITGLEMRAHGKLDLNEDGVIVLPGAAGSVDENSPDSLFARVTKAAQGLLGKRMIEAFSKDTLTIATVCGGSMLLSFLGLLKGRNATTHHMGLDIIKQNGANVIPARVVDDGKLISAGAVTSGLDLAIYLVEKLCGTDAALAVEQMFEYERRGVVWKATDHLSV